MSDVISHVLSVPMGSFAIMNPIANVPIFLGLTADDSPDHVFPLLLERQWVPSVPERLALPSNSASPQWSAPSYTSSGR